MVPPRRGRPHCGSVTRRGRSHCGSVTPAALTVPRTVIHFRRTPLRYALDAPQSPPACGVGGGALDAPQIILSATGKIVEKYILSSERIQGILVAKYVIMPNHIHLLICIDQTNGTSGAPSPTNHAIPRMVSALKRLVNRQVGQNIFQRSYYDHVIRDEADYLEKWNYIDTNPARWEKDPYHC